jgi:hypothetical protein
VSSRSWPRWWNFMTSVKGLSLGTVCGDQKGAFRLTGCFEPLQCQKQNGGHCFGRDLAMADDVSLLERWWRCRRLLGS